MKLHAKVQLSLPRSYNEIKVAYNTYEKVTYDQYLATVILTHSKTIEKANKYIDDITGKGSLNLHFKQLLNDIKGFGEETRNRILNNSLYPISKIDKSNNYIYYPYFNISIYKNKTYQGDLKKLTKKEVISILNINYDVVGVDYDEKNEEKTDSYDIEFLDDEIRVKINNEFYEINSNDFKNAYKTKIDKINEYKGLVNNTINGEGWKSLTESLIDNIKSSSLGFYQNGNHFTIFENSIREIEIANIYDIYFYNEQNYYYDNNHSEKIREILQYLFQNNSINEVKTTVILKIMNVVGDLLSQKVVNYILSKKDSKEIALFGLDLIRSGLDKEWETEALVKIKKHANESDINSIYKLSNKLEYTVQEIVKIDDDLLSNKHKKIKKEYLSNREKKINEINIKIGEITNSGIREKIKRVEQTDKIKKFGKKLNKMVGHKKGNVANYRDPELDKYYEEVNLLFEEYENIIKELDKEVVG